MKNNKLIGDFMDIRSTGLSVYKESAYKYHESWDWLMPVVERIGDENLLSIDIDVAYDRVVEFIKEYNNE
jgi:hypothetical protein|tara:strand:+ start:476 stop:685 length:210 start_codon:yes stop_codon:yes gene_type:complete